MMILSSSDEIVAFSLKVPKSDIERLDKVAECRRMSRAALMREGILRTIDEYEKKQGA